MQISGSRSFGDQMGLKGRLTLWRLVGSLWHLVHDDLNTHTKDGRAHIANFLIGGSDDEPTHIAIGTGAFSPELDASALATEVDRQAATRSRVATVYTNDTARYEYTFTVGGTYTFTEAGLLTAAAGGVLTFYQVFEGVPCVSNDKFRVQWDVQD